MGRFSHYHYPQPQPAPQPAWYTSSNPGPVVEGAGAFVDLGDLGTVELEANSRYIGFFSVDVNNSDGSGLTEVRILVNGASIHTVPLKGDLRGTSSYLISGGIFFLTTTTAATPTVKLQGRRLTAGNATFTNARLSLIKLAPADAIAESLALQTWADPTNKTAQTAATLTFTPGAAGDYLIIASFLPNITAAANCVCTAQLVDGSGNTTELPMGRGSSDGSLNPCVFLWPRIGISGAQSVSLKMRQSLSGSTTIGVAEVRLAAIRLDRFTQVEKTRLTVTNSGPETSYTTAHSQNVSPIRQDYYLALASWMQSQATSGFSSVRFVDGGVTLNECIALDSAGQEDGDVPGFSHQIALYPASTRTQSLDRKASAGTAFLIGDSEIVALNLSNVVRSS